MICVQKYNQSYSPSALYLYNIIYSYVYVRMYEFSVENYFEDCKNIHFMARVEINISNNLAFAH